MFGNRSFASLSVNMLKDIRRPQGRHSIARYAEMAFILTSIDIPSHNACSRRPSVSVSLPIVSHLKRDSFLPFLTACEHAGRETPASAHRPVEARTSIHPYVRSHRVRICVYVSFAEYIFIAFSLRLRFPAANSYCLAFLGAISVSETYIPLFTH